MKLKKVFVFDLKNIQEDYARCLQFIEIYENQEISTSDKEKNILELCRKIKIFYGHCNKNIADKHLEMPLEKNISNKSEIMDNEDNTVIFKKEKVDLSNIDFKHKNIFVFIVPRINQYYIIIFYK